MQINNRLFCHWDLVRFVQEEHLKQDDGTLRTLSVINSAKDELMIFLGKDKDSSEYEVLVYKNESTDKYVPLEEDNVKRYEENDELATFFFDEFDPARDFVDWLGYNHPEYRVRPVERKN